jgi:hypothetical protein
MWHTAPERRSRPLIGMERAMPSTNSAKNGAEVLLDQLESHGVVYVFASLIAVMAPIWEALARRGNDMMLRYFRCRHELLAVGAGSEYYKATGRSMSPMSVERMALGADECACPKLGEHGVRPARRLAHEEALPASQVGEGLSDGWTGLICP